MRLGISVDGLKDVQRDLRFSDRRIAAVGSTALTRTARQIGKQWEAQLTGKLDRPTPQTQRAVVVIPATAATLEATVLIKDQAAAGGRAPEEWLATEERGGQRYVKKFEQALISSGAMPQGLRAVPARYAKLDSYGNVSRSQIVQVLAQLGQQLSPGYKRVISASATKRAQKAVATGRNYIAIQTKIKGGPAPGVYQRTLKGLLPVFFFTGSVGYRKRLDLQAAAQQQAPVVLTREIERAIGESFARLMARGR